MFPAPAGLCERCAYVASVRVSHQHQCDSTGAINLGFEGAAIVLLPTAAAPASHAAAEGGKVGSMLSSAAGRAARLCEPPVCASRA